MNRLASTMTLMLLAACAMLPQADARVEPQQAARLGHDLTPVGAERAGNGDNSIPAWDGGLTTPPACFEGGGSRYCSPFSDDTPLFVITRDSVDRYRDHLTPGQLEMFRKYPETYRLPVYRTRRTFANPAFVYEATLANATTAELTQDGESITGASTGVPFPLPANGEEAIWNHKLRYRDPSVQRSSSQLKVTEQGRYEEVKVREDLLAPYSRQRGARSGTPDNRLFYLVRTVTAPARLSDSVFLAHATMDPVQDPRAAWLYAASTRRWVRWPEAGYDVPGPWSDGLWTNDQIDTFFGALDRYDWKLIGKREIYVPANAYELHGDRHRYADLVRKGHLNPDLTRYELRRVWVVEASLKSGASHEYRRRVFFMDEDGWQIRLVDLYNASGKLWRVQETHTVVAYDKPYEMPVCEAVYDLESGRYAVQAVNNEEQEAHSVAFDEDHFSPDVVVRGTHR